MRALAVLVQRVGFEPSDQWRNRPYHPIFLSIQF